MGQEGWWEELAESGCVLGLHSLQGSKTAHCIFWKESSGHRDVGAGGGEGRGASLEHVCGTSRVRWHAVHRPHWGLVWGEHSG